MSRKLLSLFIVSLLLVSVVSVSSNFALADDKDKNKKTKTLQDYCATLDDKTGFPGLVCAAISGITSSIQNLQDQINQMQFTAQRCPPGQEMVGINVNRQIICENPNFQSATSVIVTINPVSIQISPNPNSLTSIALAAVGLSPNSQVIVDDGLGHQIGTGTSDNKGGFSYTVQMPTFGATPGNYTLRVTDSNGRTGSAMFALVTPPPPPPSGSVQLNPTSGPAGTSLTITATGFTPNSAISISVPIVGITLSTGTTDGTGQYSVTVIVPPGGPPGFNFQIVATDSHGVTGSAGFTLTP